ncbi:MAG: hypothetical protein WBM13_09255, partial [Bacteroidia bacterium]
MKEISVKESITEFELFSKSTFSSIRFVWDSSQFKFLPSPIAINFLRVFYIVALFLPHFIYFIGSFTADDFWNLRIYIILIIVGISLSLLFALFLPIYQIVIDKLTKEVILTPKDAIGRYLQKKKYFKIEDIAEIDHIEIKSKSKTEVYLTLVPKKGKAERLFALSNWDNVTKIKAAFSALVFNKDIPYDDSNEPSVQFDEKIEQLKNEKDGETSYLPFITFLIALFALIVGFFIYFSLGKVANYCGQIESLQPVIFKYWGVCMGLFFIPLFFASQTSYQKRKKSSKKTFLVLGSIAMLGFYLLCFGFIYFFNVKLDKSSPIHGEATVLDAYYSYGSKSSSGKYVIIVQLEGSTDKIEIKHRDIELHKNLSQKIGVSIFQGYFNKKWLKIE